MVWGSTLLTSSEDIELQCGDLNTRNISVIKDTVQTLVSSVKLYSKIIFWGNILIFDDGSFHTEPSPHQIRLFRHQNRNIKGNNFFRLSYAWVSSVRCGNYGQALKSPFVDFSGC